jgi:hypothetical protein
MSDDGGTAFFRFGSLLSHATSPSTKLEPNATATIFWMNFFIGRNQHTTRKIANSNSTTNNLKASTQPVPRHSPPHHHPQRTELSNRRWAILQTAPPVEALHRIDSTPPPKKGATVMVAPKNADTWPT